VKRPHVAASSVTPPLRDHTERTASF
jgi:hypothetical protein